MRKTGKILVALGVVSLALCGAASLLVFGQLASHDSFLGLGIPVKGLDPAETLRKTTSLQLPNDAKIDRFEYVPSLDDYMVLRFSLPKRDALAFMRQKPFATWERVTTDLADKPGFWDSKPKPPFRSTSVALSNARFLDAFVEEREYGRWRIWINWNET